MKTRRPVRRTYARRGWLRVVTATVLGWASGPSRASGGEALRALLPQQDEVRPWSPADEPLAYTAESLFNFIDGGAEVYLEYGFVELVSQEYAQEEHSLICTIYEMKDPEAAFGVFSYQRTPQKSTLSLGGGAFAGPNQVAFWQDRYFVTLETFSTGEAVEGSLRRFGRIVSRKIARQAPVPAVIEKLPGPERIAGTEKLLRGRLAVRSLFFLVEADLFALGPADRVLYAEYELPSGKAKLFLMLYAEEDKAEGVYRALQKAFGPEKGYQSLEQGQGAGASYWKHEDGLCAASKGQGIVAVVTGAASVEEARRLMDRAIGS